MLPSLPLQKTVLLMPLLSWIGLWVERQYPAEPNIMVGYQTFAVQIVCMSDHQSVGSDIIFSVAIKRKRTEPTEYSLFTWFMACIANHNYLWLLHSYNPMWWP